MKILGIIGMILFIYEQIKSQITYKKENKQEPDTEKNILAHQQQIIELCIDLLKPNGKVLQFGFSHGFSGDKILNYNIKDLLIIEENKNLSLSKIYRDSEIFNQRNLLIIVDQLEDIFVFEKGVFVTC